MDLKSFLSAKSKKRPAVSCQVVGINYRELSIEDRREQEEAFLNLLRSLAPYMDEQGVDCPIHVAMPAADLRAAPTDVAAAGSASVIIAIRDGEVVFRVGVDASCWIGAPAAMADGIGYSGLDLSLLLPCVPDMAGLTADISLSSKGDDGHAVR